MFWQEDDEGNEALANNLNKMVEGMSERKFLTRVLWICGLANLFIWLCVIIFPTDISEAFVLVNNISGKITSVTLGVPFGLGLFFAYALFRLKFPDIENQNLDSNLMASYNYQAHSLKRRWVWLLSVIVGVVNVLLLILTDIFLSGDFKEM